MFKQTKTLDNILSGFTKTLNELELFVKNKTEENTSLQQEILQKQANILSNEANINVADRAMNSIKSLIGNSYEKGIYR